MFSCPGHSPTDLSIWLLLESALLSKGDTKLIMELWFLADDKFWSRLPSRVQLILNLNLFIILLIHREEAIASALEHVGLFTHWLTDAVLFRVVLIVNRMITITHLEVRNHLRCNEWIGFVILLFHLGRTLKGTYIIHVLLLLLIDDLSTTL